ncbi:hypothetical protein DFH08DRAFT_804967 [Mycena albidolilacea]|uniref:Uncharacterized protein n=1 Tax=Mycena albidolilacea TaxID=1033008 RepID=A0AAD7ABE7_9AGAR|nr:hypothetical protein DFH08DRAFT_804967 [Mycena albidolilacea]
MTEEDQQQAVADFLVYIIKLAHSRDGRIGLSQYMNDPRQLFFLADLIGSSNSVEEVHAHLLEDSAAREVFDLWDDIDGVEADAENDFVVTLQSTRRIPGEGLETVLLDSQAHWCLSADPILANCSKKVWSKADVEFYSRTTQGHFVAEGMNIVDGHDQDDQERYYPRKGKPGCSPVSSHAFADVEISRGVVEIKPLSLINDGFIPEDFLGGCCSKIWDEQGLPLQVLSA